MKARAFFLLAALWPGIALAEVPQPWRMVRVLQELQTGIVQGKARARDDQANVVADIGRQMLMAEPSAWQDQRNARAAIIWLLSGGSPHVMRRVMLAGPWPEAEGNWARGALAYVEGRAPQARDILLNVDARQLDPALGGQLALVQAALVLPESRDRAIQYLAWARVISPGTLVEETALRRQISLVGETTDAASFASLSRQYSRRFKASLYAEDFRHAFAETFTRIGISAAAEQVEQLAPILESFDADERCRLAILISRASLIEGAWRSAIAFSDRVMQPPVAASCDVPRARLYRAAVRIAEPDSEADMMALEKLDPERLGEEDRAIRKAGLHYAALVRQWPEPKAPDQGEALRGDDTLAAADKALNDSQSVMKGKRR